MNMARYRVQKTAELAKTERLMASAARIKEMLDSIPPRIRWIEEVQVGMECDECGVAPRCSYHHLPLGVLVEVAKRKREHARQHLRLVSDDNMGEQ